MADIVYRPIHRDPYDGINEEIPDGAIVNIGGTACSNFTVGGVAVVLANGSASDGSAFNITLDSVYHREDGNEHAIVSMEAGRDVIFRAANGNDVRINSATGDVLISGALTVVGESTVVESGVTDYDHILLSPKSGNTIPLKIRYDGSGMPWSSYMEIYDNEKARPIFYVDRSGSTYVESLELPVGGLVDGVDISELNSEFLSHSHNANQITVTNENPDVNSVQEYLDFLNVSVNIDTQNIENLQSGIADLRDEVSRIQIDQAVEPVGTSFDFPEEHVVWTINHGKNSRNFTMTLFDTSGSMFMPDRVLIIDGNTIEIRMTRPVSGFANLIFFTTGSAS